MRDEPMITDTMFPKADTAMRKLRARTEFLEPKTVVKKREAASWVEFFRVCLGTGGLLDYDFKKTGHVNVVLRRK
jgi:hypothetical protein